MTDMRGLREAFMAFMNSDGWTAAQRVLYDHPALLSSAGTTLANKIVLEQESSPCRDSAAQFANLLTRCRDTSIEQAIVEARGPSFDRVFVPLRFAPLWATAERLEAAVIYDPLRFDELLGVYRDLIAALGEGNYPIFRSVIENNLGLAYAGLPSGDPADSLRSAIACYEEALRFLTPADAPLEYAITVTNLGNAYFSLPFGNPTKNLGRAVECFTRALCIFTPERTRLLYARAATSMGIALAALPADDKAKTLRSAISFFKRALAVLSPTADATDYAMVQNNLGISYSDLPIGDRSANYRRAIACFRRAMRVYTLDKFPYDYAMAQNNLGAVFVDLPAGNRIFNLRSAITCYREALRVYSFRDTPFDYAMAQNNVGNCLIALPAGDRMAQLEEAIRCFNEALRVFTPEKTPYDYARTQGKLGNAYLLLPGDDRVRNLEHAIESYNKAASFLTPDALPAEYAQIQNNLGNAYTEMLPDDFQANLARAVDCYKKALQFRTLKFTPYDYAATQTNLGRALLELAHGDKARIKQAIQCYTDALRVFTPESTPRDYATTQSNLGMAYSQLLSESPEYRTKAITCYDAALKIRTLTSFPNDCRTTAMNLGNLYFGEHSWELALSSYDLAMEAGELLYRAGLSAKSKTAQVSASSDLYRNAAYALARLDRHVDALLTLERGRTRLLVETLRLRILRPENVPRFVWKSFEHASAKLRASQPFEYISDGQESAPMQEYTRRVMASRQAQLRLDSAIEKVRKYAPGFLSPLDASNLRVVVPDNSTAFVAFCLTDQGSLAFVMQSQSDRVVQIVDLPSFKRRDLQELMLGRPDDVKAPSGWVDAYLAYRGRPGVGTLAAWQTAIDRALDALGSRLIHSILAVLLPSVQRLILLPSDDLFLLPLHAVSLLGTKGGHVVERYRVQYAPSIQVLADLHDRLSTIETPAATLGCYAVINPQHDRRLPFAGTEGTSIARVFGSGASIDRIGSVAGVTGGAPGHSYVHFACHGSYNWTDPLQSGISLSDGTLTLADLQEGTLDLSAVRLVTLSACETGVTDVREGHAAEYVGLPAGFLVAGVPCVLSSLWAVPDISTALLMDCFYHNLVDQEMDPATALSEAQLGVRNATASQIVDFIAFSQAAVREKSAAGLLWGYRQQYEYMAEHDPTRCPFEHPYYWAAFLLSGYATTSIRKAQP